MLTDCRTDIAHLRLSQMPNNVWINGQFTSIVFQWIIILTATICSVCEAYCGHGAWDTEVHKPVRCVLPTCGRTTMVPPDTARVAIYSETGMAFCCAVVGTLVRSRWIKRTLWETLTESSRYGSLMWEWWLENVSNFTVEYHQIAANVHRFTI